MTSQADDMHIELHGVQTHNLKRIAVRFPLGRVTVVTGRSGSGKSSLVFDTLYAESYRRYVESLSSFARQYLKALPKPEVEEVRHLPPAIAVRQSRSGANARSTVGTMTEMQDILRIVYTHLSEIWCPHCHIRVQKDTGQSIANDICREEILSGKALILAPLTKWQGMKEKDLAEQLAAQGFARLFVDGQVLRLEELDAKPLLTADVIIDRVSLGPDSRLRVKDSAALALQVGRGRAAVYHETLGRLDFSADLSCSRCHRLYKEPSLALFNHNHPLGACAACQGFGRTSTLDWDKVVPDMDASLTTKGIAPWNFGQHAEMYQWAASSAKKHGIDPKKAFAAYSPAEWRWLKEGDGRGDFTGVEGYFAYLDTKKYKAHYRIHAARFRTYVTCDTCQGKRLNELALACQINGCNIADVVTGDVSELRAWLQALHRQHPEAEGPAARTKGREPIEGLREAFDEAEARLRYLDAVGLSYLSLHRPSNTLSGGEIQRINMARCLGSALTATLFCLDEPSSGLHARDTKRLVGILRELQAQGNTVVVVEHEAKLIEEADHLIALGPDAGHEGGELAFIGSPRQYAQNHATVWQAGKPPAPTGKNFIELSDVSTNNLKAVAVRIPVGHFTAVCGVSGSGKTSLIQHTLFPLLAEALGQELDSLYRERCRGSIGPNAVLRGLHQVVLVSQENLARSTRSNLATYLGFFDDIRKLLAAQEAAKARKLTPGAFSFNVPGGRCEHCKGLGTTVEDLSFLGEMSVLCSVCAGRRFKDEVLAVSYRGRNLIHILQLTVSEAREFFHDIPALRQVLGTVVDLGLGYVTLGQHTSSLSGGEAQRLKLLHLLKDAKTAKPSVLIFDEPTTGLSDYDVGNLLRQLRDLSAQGHTIVVVEHHLGALQSADWLIEVGPEAGAAGGRIVYQGPPAGLAQVAESRTAPFLSKKAHRV